MQPDLDDRFERETLISEAADATCARLHKLVQRGYVAELGSNSGAIWLHHPSRRFRHAKLILYPSGMIVSMPAGDSELRIEREQHSQFAAFIATVPKPTVWERSRPTRDSIFVWAFFALLFAVSWWASKAVEAMW
jgi:hypothetical protein